MYLYLIQGALVQTLIFQDDAGGHFGFGPLGKNAGIFAKGRVSNFLIKGPLMSNQSSKHVSRRMVTGLRSWTQLCAVCLARGSLRAHDGVPLDMLM